MNKLLAIAVLCLSACLPPVVQPIADAGPNSCEGQSCSGQGTCAVVNGASAVCVCNAGFFSEGLACRAVMVGQECSGVTCSGHGTCAVANGAPLCSCDAGYDRVGDSCVARMTTESDAGGGACAGVTCSGRGVCAVVGGTTASCLCNVGYLTSGTDCVLAGTSTGTLTLLAGAIGAGASADGPVATARLTLPVGVAADAMGNFFVTEQGGVIRKVSSSGIVSTLAGLAGAGEENLGYVNAQGAAARFGRLRPASIAVDPNGTVFVMDTDNCAIRQVTPAGVVTTFAGAPPDASGQPVCGADDVTPFDGAGAAARFVNSGGIWTVGLTRDSAGNLYTLQNRRSAPFQFYVRKITPAGVVSSTLITGITTEPLISGTRAAVSGDGLTLHLSSDWWIARVSLPSGAWTNIAAAPTVTRDYTSICTTSAGTPYVTAEALVSNSGIYRQSAWVVRVNGTALVDVASTEAGADGYVDGVGSAARFRQGLAIFCDDANGRLLVADKLNNVVRAINTTTNAVTTVAGIGATIGAAVDGTGSAARFGAPGRLAADGAGNWFLTDTGSHTVRKVSASGAVTTFAGQLGTSGTMDGAGSAARFNAPVGLAIDSAAALYVGDRGRIRKISAAGVVTTLATAASGLNTANAVRALAVDATSQTLFYAAGDSGNFLAGTSLMRVSASGAGTPVAVDTLNREISGLAVDVVRRRLYAATIGGSLRCFLLTDPAAIPLPTCGGVTLPSFDNPTAAPTLGQLALSPGGTLYVTRSDSTVVKVLTVAPYTATVAAGAPDAFGVELGPLPARLFAPTGLAINPLSGQLGIISQQDGALLVTNGFTP